MLATAWRGGTYGIRIGAEDRAQYFKREWVSVIVEIGDQAHTLNLSPSFWNRCPELRSVVIERWLRAQGHLPWPKGEPPQFELTPLGGNRFRLT